MLCPGPTLYSHLLFLALTHTIGDPKSLRQALPVLYSGQLPLVMKHSIGFGEQLPLASFSGRFFYELFPNGRSAHSSNYRV